MFRCIPHHSTQVICVPGVMPEKLSSFGFPKICWYKRAVTQPAIQLKGFKREIVDAGKSQIVEIKLPSESVEKVGMDFKTIIESGEFKILVGNSSVTEKLTERMLKVD